MREITRCEVCGSHELEPVLDLGKHPLCDDLVEVGDGRVCAEYPIEILFCPTCITAHQRFQIPKRELFPPTYHYRARYTADVLNGMKQLVDACADTLGPVAGKTVVDVGCNDGSLLTFFRSAGAAKTCGIEPTGAAVDARENGHLVYNDFLTEEVARRVVADVGHPDIVTFTNVFAHIEDLPAVVRALLVLAHDRTAIVIENHYLGAIIDRGQFDTFYHEHPRTYSATSLGIIARSLKRRIAKLEFPARYGGNIRAILLPGGENEPHDCWDENVKREATFGRDLADLAKSVSIWRTSKLKVLRDEVARHGSLPAKAFPGRSAIPIKLLGLDETLISAVYEKPGSQKIGHYVPGTRIPIRSDDDFDAAGSKGPMVNMAWHLADEIRAYMRGRGYSGGLIDIIAPEDFEAAS